MTARVLVVSLLAMTLIPPAVGGATPSIPVEIAPPPVLDTVDGGGLKAAADFWVRHRLWLHTMAFRPVSSRAAFLNDGGRTASRCSGELALASYSCAGECDAAKESCDRQCGAKRSSCMATCPALGFMCDSSCQAAYFICKGNCGKAHASCLSNCRSSGGERN